MNLRVNIQSYQSFFVLYSHKHQTDCLSCFQVTYRSANVTFGHWQCLVICSFSNTGPLSSRSQRSHTEALIIDFVSYRAIHQPWIPQPSVFNYLFRVSDLRDLNRRLPSLVCSLSPLSLNDVVCGNQVCKIKYSLILSNTDGAILKLCDVR